MGRLWRKKGNSQWVDYFLYTCIHMDLYICVFVHQSNHIRNDGFSLSTVNFFIFQF